MCVPWAENLSGESIDSSSENQQPSVSIQTEWSYVQGTNYQESVEESSKLEYWHLIGHKVYKRFGQEIYEGALEGYNVVTNLFKVVYDNGYFDEIEGHGLISYLLHHRNNNGENPSPSAPAQPSRKVPPNCRFATKNMITTPSENNGGRVKKRPLMMRARTAGASSRPRQARKHRVISSTRKGLMGENVNLTAPGQPSTEVANEGSGRKRALRMRARNAGDIAPPRQASKCRVRHSPKRSLLYEEYKRSAYCYYSPSSDEGDDDDEDSDWEE